MPQVPISPEIYAYSEIIETDINTVSGISEYARGAMPEIRRTATEASIIADAQNARASDKLAIVELSIAMIGRRVIQLLQQFMTGESTARVPNAPNDLFVPFNRDDIVGEYDYTVEAGSTQPLNDTIRKQQAVSLLNAMGPLVGTVINPQALAAHVLKTGFDIKDPERFLMQPQRWIAAGRAFGPAQLSRWCASGTDQGAGTPHAAPWGTARRGFRSDWRGSSRAAFAVGEPDGT